MKAVIQRVKSSQVKVDGQVVGQIGHGLNVLLGVGQGDTSKQAEDLARKIANLRIFADDQDKMNCSVKEVGGEILVVSQFTLYGDCRKGNRPSFVRAAEPKLAEELYEHFVRKLMEQGLKVVTGQFRTLMEVTIVNDGPVTIIWES